MKSWHRLLVWLYLRAVDTAEVHDPLAYIVMGTQLVTRDTGVLSGIRVSIDALDVDNGIRAVLWCHAASASRGCANQTLQ